MTPGSGTCRLLSLPALAAQEINNAIAAATRGHITGLLGPQSLGRTWAGC